MTTKPKKVVLSWTGDSSNVDSYTYYDDETLVITFKRKGGNKSYSYSAVSPMVAEDLQKAESKGVFINAYIVPVFQAVQVFV